MRFEKEGKYGPTLVVSRRNLLALLAKLDGYPPDSECMIERQGLYLMAEEDDVHYADRPAGRMHADTEKNITKPTTGTQWSSPLLLLCALLGEDPHEPVHATCSRCHRLWGMERIDAMSAYSTRWRENVCFECEPEGW